MFATVALLTFVVGALGDSPSRPNLLLLMTDQHRFDAFSYMGNTALSTPNFDRLAAEGLVLCFSYSSTPSCTPARAAILTGQKPWNHGMLGYGAVADKYPVELAETLASAGYRTAIIGKNHFGWNQTTTNGIAHGYNNLTLYDGLGDGVSRNQPYFDDYDQWFQTVQKGQNPLCGMDWNQWKAKPYCYEAQQHPTAWVGQQAVDGGGRSRHHTIFSQSIFPPPALSV